MPSVNESVNAAQQLQGYEPISRSTELQSQIPAAPSTDLAPGYNPYLRCPIPPIWQSAPDSLRQFYNGASVPQVRLFNPNT
jgi:hypothetical protein